MPASTPDQAIESAERSLKDGAHWIEEQLAKEAVEVLEKLTADFDKARRELNH